MLWIDPGRICPSLQRASTMTLRLSINKDVDYFESTLHVRLSFVSIFAEFVSVTYLTGILCDVFHHCGVSDDDFDFFFLHTHLIIYHYLSHICNGNTIHLWSEGSCLQVKYGTVHV